MFLIVIILIRECPKTSNFFVDIRSDKKCKIFKCSFLRRAHGTDQTPFSRVLPPGTYLTAESTDAMRFMYKSQGHNVQMQPALEPSSLYPETDMLSI